MRFIMYIRVNLNKSVIVNIEQTYYSLRSIILVADSEAIHKICLDKSKFATRILELREYCKLGIS
jgi:hypothetical protein